MQQPSLAAPVALPPPDVPWHVIDMPCPVPRRFHLFLHRQNLFSNRLANGLSGISGIPLSSAVIDAHGGATNIRNLYAAVATA
jgi:hypothetical protein